MNELSFLTHYHEKEEDIENEDGDKHCCVLHNSLSGATHAEIDSIFIGLRSPAEVFATVEPMSFIRAANQGVIDSFIS